MGGWGHLGFNEEVVLVVYLPAGDEVKEHHWQKLNRRLIQEGEL